MERKSSRVVYPDEIELLVLLPISTATSVRVAAKVPRPMCACTIWATALESRVCQLNYLLILMSHQRSCSETCVKFERKDVQGINGTVVSEIGFSHHDL